MKYKSSIWNLLKKFSNLNVSIIMLLVIALFSILGTIIEQDQTIAYYQENYPISRGQLWKLEWTSITNLGLNHVYTTWWFLCLLVLFFISLIVCTFSRQLPGLKNARKWKFLQSSKAMQKFKDYKSIQKNSFSSMIYSLNHNHYYVFHKKGSIYAYKGLFGRVAPIFVHISIILTLTGSLVGLFGGFSAQEMIPSGELFHIQNVVISGISSHLPYNLVGKVDEFRIEYNRDHSIKQFFSTISLIDNNNISLVAKHISVNSPLKFRGITFYQTDWQINALRIQIGSNSIIQKSLVKIKTNNTFLWVCNLPVSHESYISIVLTSLEDDIFIYNINGLLIAKTKANEIIMIDHTPLIIKEVMTSTGLQIKTDPGIGLVYTSFLILMVSVVISYLSYSQIWTYSQSHNIELAGLTNRAALNFEEDLVNIQKDYIKSILTK
uniref:Cytochrome c biogenesis protein CcsB n=1 Tax=Ahnfeltia plicata TaxID=28023 RepID=A0A1C9CB78_9FLOR|nr:c-type cytochrome biogenensis protein [Ahnfeltia plicata]AOM65619.1 c-type cytochrome biogenensis protein [Ahnfeltia plicata]UAT97136.1 c-type cytochrome biogenensis protein [Ahnfeltia plicata]UAT97341.1 c-type cytochrome biogenensis protein [Ahnfeltia plicata]